MPTGIYLRTEQMKESIRKNHKGMDGLHHTDEAKRKIGLASSIFNKGRKHENRKKGHKVSKETRKKMSISKRNMSVETRQKIRLANLGKKLSEKTKRKISGANSHWWKGGLSYEPYSVDWTKTLRCSIRERDHYVCQLCNQYGNYVHHIDYNKKNCNPENLVTLCNKCHLRTNGNREYWKHYFIWGDL